MRSLPAEVDLLGHGDEHLDGLGLLAVGDERRVAGVIGLDAVVEVLAHNQSLEGFAQ